MKQGINGTTAPGPCDSPVVSSLIFILTKTTIPNHVCIYLFSFPVFLKMQAIRFFMSSNLTVKGLKVKNSPQFNFRFDGCQSVHVDSLIIKAPAQSPNTDGIHIENTVDVKIHNSIISNGNLANT